MKYAPLKSHLTFCREKRNVFKNLAEPPNTLAPERRPFERLIRSCRQSVTVIALPLLGPLPTARSRREPHCAEAQVPQRPPTQAPKAPQAASPPASLSAGGAGRTLTVMFLDILKED